MPEGERAAKGDRQQGRTPAHADLRWPDLPPLLDFTDGACCG
jgi:hypothetical protein